MQPEPDRCDAPTLVKFAGFHFCVDVGAPHLDILRRRPEVDGELPFAIPPFADDLALIAACDVGDIPSAQPVSSIENQRKPSRKAGYRAV